MLDDILGVVVDFLVASIPDVVWKLIILVVGCVVAGIGVTMLEESTRLGLVLLGAGSILAGGSLISLLR